MPLNSMTGFARAAGVWQDHRWTWEIKSVNSKGLDLRLRLPTGFETIEPSVRRHVSKTLARGHVNATLQVERDSGAGDVVVNELVLDRLVEAATQAAKKHGLKKPRAETLIGVRGVIEMADSVLDEAERATRDEAILDTLYQAVGDLQTMRATEGAALERVLADQVHSVSVLTGQARACASHQPDVIKERLHQQIADMLSGSPVDLDNARIAQEAAFLAVKANVTEELDRLDTHVAAARDLLAGGSPAGRKLDFLSQEFSREANTLCSKAADADMSSIGLELKAVIDQMREQVQNIE